jgi:adenylosuccinate lyase
VIPRYTLPEMAAVWSDDARLSHWLEIEVLVVEAWARLGRIPETDARQVRERATFDLDRVNRLEDVTKHDVAAFVQDVGRSVGPAGRWVHFGLTSSDVLDTAFGLQLRDAADLLLSRLERLLAIVRHVALEHRDTVMVGRTHGVHAEPTSFGHKVALWAFELDRDRERLRRAREHVSVGKISGAVGTYAQVEPAVEEEVCSRLGLRPAEASSQIVPRDRHAEYMATLAVAAGTLDLIATEIRHLARTEVREVQEPFTEGQKGSSAMPHKRNPVRCERITGLARVVRADAQAAFENQVLWHERDISHSSAERVIFPDATIALDFMLAELADVLENLRVHPERMRANLEADGGLAYSQTVLLALVEAGLSRDDSYAAVQRAAAKAWDEGGDFRAELRADPDVRRALPVGALDAPFDPARALRNLDVVFDRLAKLEVEEGGSGGSSGGREGASGSSPEQA